MGNSKAISQGACPFCDSSDAFTLYDDGHGYCFSCGGYQHADKNNTKQFYLDNKHLRVVVNM